MNRRMLSAASWLMTGETSVLGSSGAPRMRVLVDSPRRSRNSFMRGPSGPWGSTTMQREQAEHFWPWNPKAE